MASPAFANDAIDSLFDEAQAIVDRENAKLIEPATQPLTPAPVSSAPPEEQEACVIGLTEIQTDLADLKGQVAKMQGALVEIDSSYQAASVAVPLGTITKCTDDLSAPLDDLIAEVSEIDFGPIRTSTNRLTACVVQQEAELNFQNDAYRSDTDSLSSRDALLLAAKLKLVSEVSGTALEVSHEVERLESKKNRMANAISDTRSFCVDDF